MGTCHLLACTSPTSRSEAHMCGVRPGGDEYGCGGHFCSKHLHLGWEGDFVQRCPSCHLAEQARVSCLTPQQTEHIVSLTGDL